MKNKLIKLINLLNVVEYDKLKKLYRLKKCWVKININDIDFLQDIENFKTEDKFIKDLINLILKIDLRVASLDMSNNHYYSAIKPYFELTDEEAEIIKKIKE